MSEGQPYDEVAVYERVLYPDDPKIPVYDAVDILPLLGNFPHLKEKLRGMTVFFRSGYYYLIRHEVWEKGGPELRSIVFSGGDPRCDSHRMSGLADVGTFEPDNRPPVA